MQSTLGPEIDYTTLLSHARRIVGVCPNHNWDLAGQLDDSYSCSLHLVMLAACSQTVS